MTESPVVKSSEHHFRFRLFHLRSSSRTIPSSSSQAPSGSTAVNKRLHKDSTSHNRFGVHQSASSQMVSSSETQSASPSRVDMASSVPQDPTPDQKSTNNTTVNISSSSSRNTPDVQNQKESSSSSTGVVAKSAPSKFSSLIRVLKPWKWRRSGRSKASGERQLASDHNNPDIKTMRGAKDDLIQKSTNISNNHQGINQSIKGL